MINAPGSRKRRKALFPQDLSPPFVECLVCWTGITQMRLKLIADSDTIKARLWTWVVQRAFIGAWNKILRVSTKTKTKHLRKGEGVRFVSQQPLLRHTQTTIIRKQAFKLFEGSTELFESCWKLGFMSFYTRLFTHSLSTRRRAEQRPANLGAWGEVSSNL